MLRESTRRCLTLTILALFFAGCAVRVAGQVELLGIDTDGKLKSYAAYTQTEDRRNTIPSWGEPVRSNDDVLAIQVESAYIQNLPCRLTGSKDVIIFADVWEDAAMGFNSSASLTSIVYVGPNQKVPGRLNFRDMLAYGPAKFKGHPLRIRFTIMVLQKRTADNQSSAIDIISSIAEAAAPQYSPITSQVAKALKGILKAQPDIAFFDFDATLTSDRPDGLATIAAKEGTAQGKLERGRVRPSRTFQPSAPTTGEAIHWLRYGRYALLETESYDGKTSAVDKLKKEDVYDDDGWLRDSTGHLLPTSYMIFRVTPGQLDEGNEVLLAASNANVELLKTLRRSDAEIKEGLDAITQSAGELKKEVLRVKAEDLARRIVKDEQAKGTAPDKIKQALDKRFKERWDQLTRGVPEGADIGKDVVARWKAKLDEVGTGDAGGGGGNEPAPPPASSMEGVIQALKTTDNKVTAGSVKLEIEDVTFDKSAGAAEFDIANVAFVVPANGGNKTSEKVLRQATAALVNKVIRTKSGGGGDQITNVTIINRNALSAVLE